MVLIYLMMTFCLVNAGKHWSDSNDHHLHDNFVEERAPKSHLNRLDVVCSKDHMTVHMFFDSPFYGMVFSQSTHHQDRCVHVGPRAGVRETSFHIKYDSCGTAEDLRGQFHENTIVIQYGEDILEAWDEAKRLRCEWLESFEKESSKNTLAISEIDIVELNFQGDDIDCWMEVQEGKGPWARQVAGILPIGSPLTLVIAINDHSREFDMRVKRCVASDGSGAEVPLTDEDGCVLRPSLLTPFAKVRDFGGRATLVAYSHLFAFKFPDTLDVFVHCVVEVCRHGCPDSCTGQGGHYPLPRDHRKDYHYTVESKKENKLVELKTPVSTTQSSIHQRKKPQYLTKIPVNVLHSLKAKGKNNHQTFNSSSYLHEELLKLNRQNDEVHKHPVGGGTYVVTEEDRKRLLGHVQNGQEVFSEVKPVPIGQYHKIIGHHAHWDAEEVRAKDEEYLKHHIPPVKEALHQPPKHPDLDSVRGLSKEEILRQHFGVTKPVHYEPVPQPQPEPATWSGDDVRPLTKHEVFHHQPNHHSGHHKETLVTHQEVFGTHFQPPGPNPEPAPWSGDNVKPLTKDEVFHHLTPNHPIHPKEPIVTHTEGFGSHFQPPSHDGANPEPAPWTYDEVRPMINPGVKHEKERFIEPKPEPASTWTLDEVKPLSKEDLKFHSLNYKLKSQPHLADALPTYKESVLPYGTKSPYTAPSPVYVPQSRAISKNMSGNMMMNMMMMMPTLLPYTYQTARWPSKTTAYARNLKTNRHHHPYPIPQFTHKQQLMMSVIADRRSDDNVDELQFEMDPRSMLEGNTGTTTKLEDRPDTTAMNSLGEDTTVATPTEGSTKAASETGPAAVRPPVVGFIPPSLDVKEINPFETKGQSAHSPRALKHRKKRSSEPVFGVKQKFQAIALTDLAFEFNSTQDGTAVLRGRREEIIYGICMSPASMSVSVGFILLLTICALMASLLLYEHSYRLRNKTSHLSVLTRTFNGRLESLYRVSRQYPNSSVR